MRKLLGKWTTYKNEGVIESRDLSLQRLLRTNPTYEQMIYMDQYIQNRENLLGFLAIIYLLLGIFLGVLMGTM
jgi:hypothetical protein